MSTKSLRKAQAYDANIRRIARARQTGKSGMMTDELLKPLRTDGKEQMHQFLRSKRH